MMHWAAHCRHLGEASQVYGARKAISDPNCGKCSPSYVENGAGIALHVCTHKPEPPLGCATRAHLFWALEIPAGPASSWTNLKPLGSSWQDLTATLLIDAVLCCAMPSFSISSPQPFGTKYLSSHKTWEGRVCSVEMQGQGTLHCETSCRDSSKDASKKQKMSRTLTARGEFS